LSVAVVVNAVSVCCLGVDNGRKKYPVAPGTPSQLAVAVLPSFKATRKLFGMNPVATPGTRHSKSPTPSTVVPDNACSW
jgi:hypothetical protein